MQPQTVELDLQTDALSVKLKSVSPQQKIAELSAQVDLLSRLLNESNDRLEACLKRIGFLECKLADERRH
ncbi:MAG TPA: hypothetical protein V6C72_19080 [Chroococcales cyanobacterium]